MQKSSLKVEKLNLLSEKIIQKINFSILQLNKDRSYVEKESEGKSNMDEKMKTLYNSKVKVLETIAEVRRAKQRLAYSSQNVFKQVDAAAAGEKDIKTRMANIGKKQKVIIQQVKDSEKASSDANRSEQAASNKYTVLDKRVRRAFSSVVRKREGKECTLPPMSL